MAHRDIGRGDREASWTGQVRDARLNSTGARSRTKMRREFTLMMRRFEVPSTLRPLQQPGADL
jgi:hypothetical protein